MGLGFPEGLPWFPGQGCDSWSLVGIGAPRAEVVGTEDGGQRGELRPRLEGGSRLTAQVPSSTAHVGLSHSGPWGPTQGKGLHRQQAGSSGCQSYLW